MRNRGPVLLVLLGLLGVLCPLKAEAQVDEDAYRASLSLLDQAVNPRPNGQYNALLRGLRHLRDPDLGPLYNALIQSPYAPQRVHGHLGLAEISADQRLDLAAVAETEDPRELVEILSAAMDDELIDAQAMATILRWQGLSLPVRQSVALRLVGEGVGEGAGFDTEPMRESIDIALDDQVALPRLMQFALGALLLAERGDRSGVAALEQLVALRGPNAEAVIGQVIEAAMRRGLSSFAEPALTIASDSERGVALRLVAMQGALRLGAPGADALWRRQFEGEADLGRRIRLVMIALDACADVEPSLYAPALEDESAYIRTIAEAGRAIAARGAGATQAVADMIATGQPLPASWVVSYCLRERPSDAAALLTHVIHSYGSAAPSNRPQLAESGVFACEALCELYPDAAAAVLAGLLNDPPAEADDERMLRQIVLLGIVRSRGVELRPIVEPIEASSITRQPEPLLLLLRARAGLELEAESWRRIEQIIRGAEPIDPALQVQFAWVYLRHIDRYHAAIRSTLE